MKNIQLAITAIKPSTAPDEEYTELRRAVSKQLHEIHKKLLEAENFITDNYPKASDTDKSYLDKAKNRIYDAIDTVIAATYGR